MAADKNFDVCSFEIAGKRCRLWVKDLAADKNFDVCSFEIAGKRSGLWVKDLAANKNSEVSPLKIVGIQNLRIGYDFDGVFIGKRCRRHRQKRSEG